MPVAALEDELLDGVEVAVGEGVVVVVVPADVDVDVPDEVEVPVEVDSLAAQSAKVSSVGGATYTSQGYLSSLQSALDKAGL